MDLYILISHNNYTEFKKLVNEYMYKGYKPQGGVCILTDKDYNLHYFQAMACAYV